MARYNHLPKNAKNKRKKHEHEGKNMNFKHIATGIMVVALLHGGLARAACNAAVPESTPTADFTDNTDGTVTHTKTGLTWMRCSLGQTWNGATCTGASGYTWQNALAAAKNTTFPAGGSTDWRLPNDKELESIVEQSCDSPAVNATIFPNSMSDWYWRDTSNAADSSGAWSVYFGNGNNGDFAIQYKTYSLYVRLVRGGQSFDSL